MKRERNRVQDVVLMNLNHKINRKSMIDVEINRICQEAHECENILLYDKMLELLGRYEDAFTETVKTPVGETVLRFVGL